MSIAELKDNLSAYLARVREGEEFLVRDRKVPIAKIVPLSATSDLSAEEAALVATGRMRSPVGSLPRSFWKMRAPRLSRGNVLRALDADREG